MNLIIHPEFLLKVYVGEERVYCGKEGRKELLGRHIWDWVLMILLDR